MASRSGARTGWRTWRSGWRAGGGERNTALTALTASGLGLVEPEQADRIALEDAGHHLGLEPGVLEVLHPAVRRDQRIVAAEQDAVLQQRVRVLHQLLREVLGTPAGEVDPDIGLV